MRPAYIGATVLYQPKDWQRELWRRTAPCPALVSDVYADGTLHLVVFPPHGMPTAAVTEIFVRHDAAGAPGTWRWPEPPPA